MEAEEDGTTALPACEMSLHWSAVAVRRGAPVPGGRPSAEPGGQPMRLACTRDTCP